MDARKVRGFTIVEVLVVVAIMSMLFGLVMIASTAIRRRAMSRATEAMIVKLNAGLQNYYELTGHYPPDGYDTEVKNSKGVPIRGAACLYEFMTKEFTVETRVSGQVRTEKHDPLMKFSDKTELSGEDPEFPEVREVLDGFGLPIHYDNTENGIFEPQGELAHMVPVDNHPPDPRTSDDTDVVPKKGIQHMGAYDLWSHGDQKAHQGQKVSLTSTIGTWNVAVERKEAQQEQEEK